MVQFCMDNTTFLPAIVVPLVGHLPWLLVNLAVVYIYHVFWYTHIWWFPKIGVPPNHPYIDGFSLINHHFWGTPIYGNLHILI